MTRRSLTMWLLFVLMLPCIATVAAPATHAAQTSGVSPVSIRIPRALVNTAIEPLGIPGGVPDEPSGTWVVGWYEETGGLGSAGVPLFYAYREFRNVGPAAFYFLDQLAPGDPVEIIGADGLVYSYQVVSLDTYDVATTDPNLLFTPTGAEQLMLFTYAPPYDSMIGYQSIVMVRASLVETSGAGTETVPPTTTECTVAPRDLVLPGGPVAPALATSGARESLGVANSMVTDDATIADIDQVVQATTNCDVAIRAAVTLPGERVLALLGPADPLELTALVASTAFSQIASDPSSTVMDFVLFTHTEGGWQAAPVPWS